MKVSKEPECPMANVLVFTTRYAATSRKQIGGNPLNRLNAGLFVDRDSMNSVDPIKLYRVSIGLADL
ncbi:MAG: hypothetical protein ACK5PB_21100 [Pirellula sp.]|jgi:hypothetical protein